MEWNIKDRPRDWTLGRKDRGTPTASTTIDALLFKIFRLFSNRNKAKRLNFTKKNLKINTLSTAKYQTSSRLIFPFARKGPTNYLVNRLKKQVGLHNPVLFSKILTRKSTTFDFTECASGVCLCVRGRGWIGIFLPESPWHIKESELGELKQSLLWEQFRK